MKLNKTMRLALVVVAVGHLTAAELFSQTPPQPLRFEVATIKPNLSEKGGIGNRFDPQLYSYTNVPLRTLIQSIYRVKDYQLVGAPGWVNSDRWDIVAKSDRPTSAAEKSQMAETLLAERFNFKFHRETREMNIYSLVVAKGGPRLQDPKDDDSRAGLKINVGLISGHKWQISTLAQTLSGELNVPVIDRTGLTGTYDFTLQWTPGPNEGNFAAVDPGIDRSSVDPLGPSIVAGLEEQLGLKLEKSRGPVEVLVIDRIEKPPLNQ